MGKSNVFLKHSFRKGLYDEYHRDGKTQTEMIQNLKKHVKEFFESKPELNKDEYALDWFLKPESDTTILRRLGLTFESKEYTISDKILQIICAAFQKKAHNITTDKFTPLFPKSENEMRETIKHKNKEIKEDYDTIVNASKKSIGKTHRYEDALVILIDKFNHPQLKKVTMVVDDLSFTFKIIVSLASFLSRENRKLCLLFDAKHGYSLLAGKELLILYKLGVHIELLDPKESFLNHGFYFNYYAPEKSESPASVEFYNLRNNLFDRSAIIKRHVMGASPEDNKIINNAMKDIALKRKKAFILQTHSPMKYEIIEEPYFSWLKGKFSSWNILSDAAPIYTTELNNGHKIRFEYKTVDFKDIFYRTKRVIAYKVFQAKRLIDANNFYCTVNDGVAEFKNLNLFSSNSNHYYAINAPFLEENTLESRYEVAEGHSRLYALSMDPRRIKQVKAIVVKGLSTSAFEIRDEFSDSNDVISNDWSRLKVAAEYFTETAISREVRNIETVTHSFPQAVYQEIGEKLIGYNIFTPQEAVNFSRGKYKL